MKPSKKAKWIIGAATVSFSALVLTQMGNDEEIKDPIQPEIMIDDSLSEKEKELLSLDWVNFEPVSEQQYQSDRTTRRS
ncbi:hypothetical protein J2S13_002179 [Oikeobacillus pervagus]|uniref:Uncharacterized protein n=1 Tax=Oikeobacillus pervagus TaxID=1325931 RepID=A0AAJ1SZY2_9BACI|nr:hypothetical protein [Oikeobacillus pervagus]MDQ0215759.1 hypothetical protein [Oikeobacillus pervagus]